jgi:phenylalanyl-tRNA synthetase beta chain
MSGLEVEELRPVAPPFHGIVVAEIARGRAASECRQAARLQGQCRRPRVAADRLRRAECARRHQGAAGHRGRRTAARRGRQARSRSSVGKLRGVESFGMLCSARELKLSEDHGGLLELSADAPIGQNIREQLQLDDTLFTLKLTPNLAHA